MAMDNFKEEIVVRRRGAGLYTAVYYLCWLFIVIFGLYGLINVYHIINTIGQGEFPWLALVLSLAMIGLAVLMYFRKDNLRVEYEYTFTNGTLDVSQVLNNSKRKYLAEIPLKIVDSCGSVQHQSFQKFLNDKMIKRHNWFLNRDNDLVYLYFTKNGVRHLAVIEPSQEMQQMMRSKNYLNFGVWQEIK